MTKVKADAVYGEEVSSHRRAEAKMSKVTADAVYGEEVSSLHLAEENSDQAKMCLQHSTLMCHALKFRYSVLMNLAAPEDEQARA